jgi:rhamnosyltransferase
MLICLFIPTFNAATLSPHTFTTTLQSIARADLHRVLIIDSSSTDNTVELVKQFGFECIVIPHHEFDHGGTRQQGLEILGDSDIIVYMTQDVLLDDPNSIINLAQVLIDNEKIAGVYGKQKPHDNADIFARHLRRYNYGDVSYVRKYNDRFIAGMRCVFSSDSFAAYKVQALKDVGGFPDHLIMGEDVYLFAKFLHKGYKVAYASDIICQHSHNYSIREVFQRYFDIGVFHQSELWILDEFGTANKDGIKFIFSELKYITIRRPWLLPLSIILILAKYFGYKLGRNYDEIGIRLCRKFSKNKTFWWQ